MSEEGMRGLYERYLAIDRPDLAKPILEKYPQFSGKTMEPEDEIELEEEKTKKSKRS